MRKYIAFIIILCGFVHNGCLAGETLPSVMRNYMIACKTMNEALANQDKSLMESALEMLDNLEVSAIPDEYIRITPTDDRISPKIYFLPEYADRLLLNDFIIAELDEASL